MKSTTNTNIQEKKQPSVCVVVARHNEPIDWLPALPEDYDIYISNSGKDDPAIPKVPNKVQVVRVANEGREAGHWIRYIAENYNGLADINVFLQGSPHIGHTNDILFHIERSHLTESFSYLASTDQSSRKLEGLGRTLIQTSVGRKYSIVPQSSGGVWGGQHYASKEAIKKYPQEYYQDILKKAASEGYGFAAKLEHAYNCVYGIPPKA